MGNLRASLVQLQTVRISGTTSGVTDIVVPWETLALSVALYVVIPLLAGALTRRRLIAVHGLSIPCNWYQERTRSNMVASSEIWECV